MGFWTKILNNPRAHYRICFCQISFVVSSVIIYRNRKQKFLDYVCLFITIPFANDYCRHNCSIFKVVLAKKIFVRHNMYKTKRIRELLNVWNIFARVVKIFLLLKLCWRAAVVHWATPQMLGLDPTEAD